MEDLVRLIGPQIKKYILSLWNLTKKEFGILRYNEETGHLEVSSSNQPCEYRGISIWFKEVLESILAFIIIIFVFWFFFNNFFPWPPSNPSKLIPDLLTYAGLFLAIDAVLLIAILISSPGIDETVDSVSVSLAAVLILFLSQESTILFNNNNWSSTLIIIVSLSLMIVLLIFAKHIIKKIRKLHNCT